MFEDGDNGEAGAYFNWTLRKSSLIDFVLVGWNNRGSLGRNYIN